MLDSQHSDTVHGVVVPAVYSQYVTGGPCSLLDVMCNFFFFFSSRRRHTRLQGDWSSDVCSSDLSTESEVEDARALQIQSPQREISPHSNGKTCSGVRSSSIRARSDYKMLPRCT